MKGRSRDHDQRISFSWTLFLISLLHFSVWSIGVCESHSRDFFLREQSSLSSYTPDADSYGQLLRLFNRESVEQQSHEATQRRRDIQESFNRAYNQDTKRRLSFNKHTSASLAPSLSKHSNHLSSAPSSLLVALSQAYIATASASSQGPSSSDSNPLLAA